MENHIMPFQIKPEDYQIIAFFVLVGVFGTWERLRPARAIDHWADLKIDLMSFSLAILMNRVSTKTVQKLAGALVPSGVLERRGAAEGRAGGAKNVLGAAVGGFHCLLLAQRDARH